MADRFLPHGAAAADADPLVVTPESAGWDYSGLRVLALAPGESRVLATGSDEVAVVPLSGSCRVEVESRSFDLAGRAGVFERVTDWAYAPIDAEVRLTSEGGGAFAWCTARAGRRLDPVHVAAEDVSIEVRGAGRATRQITNFMSVEAFAADTLICVEVYTPGGNVSSWPPHKHDEVSADELPLEEIYYFRVDGDCGLGTFRCYAADGDFDDTVTVHDGDVYLIPKGYHGPAMAPPEFPMYYLNVMAGPQRLWRFTDDPCYAWIRDEFSGGEPDARLPLVTAAGRQG